MKRLPVLRMLAGLNTSPLDAGPDHCADCLNIHSSSGVLDGRKGQKAIQAIAGKQFVPYMGWASGVSEPGAVSNVSIANGGGPKTLYVGYSATFNRVYVEGTIDNKDIDGGGTLIKMHEQMTFEYYDGETFTEIPGGVGNLFTASWSNSVAGGIIAPFYAVRSSATGTRTGELFDGVFVPPSDWALLTIGGQNLYWIRIRGVANTAAITAAAATSFVQTTENRILHVNVFRDRRGTKHTFIAYAFGDGGRELRFMCDGVVMTQSEGLQPNGAEVAGTGARMFGKKTRVTSAYHAATDRVIGHVEGLGWFYFIANGQYKLPSTSAKTHEIYALTPSATGVGTPYASVVEGLRSSIPPGVIMTLHEGRIFIAIGQRIYWSAPGPYADIWLNTSEEVLGDSGGNITGIVSVGGVLAVFKRNSIWTGQYAGTSDSPEAYEFYQIPGNVGCVAPRSIAMDGNRARFAGEDGFYAFDGQTVEKFSGAIDGLLGDRTFTSSLEDAMAVFHSPTNQYRLFYKSSSESDAFDSALYCDLSGHIMRVRGKETREVSWWKQGKYATTDYGFQATYVCTDNTADQNLMIIGDRYGVVWRADIGHYDGGTVITKMIRSHRVGLGTTKRMTARWISPTVECVGDYDFTIKTWEDGRTDHQESWTANALDAAGFSGVTFGTETFTPERTFVAPPPDQVTYPQTVEVCGSSFQVEIVDANPAPFTLHAIEVMVAPFGDGAP